MKSSYLLPIFLLLGCSKLTSPNPVKVTKSTLTIWNKTSSDTVVFMAFGADSMVLPTDISFCKATSKLNCSFSLKANSPIDLPLSDDYLNASVAFGAPVGCGSTKSELNLNNPSWYDVVDISLVDGFSNSVQVQVNDKILGPVTSSSGNQGTYGVYPLGCDICVGRESPPCGMTPDPKSPDCKSGSQYSPSVPCQHQGSVIGGGTQVTISLLPM